MKVPGRSWVPVFAPVLAGVAAAVLVGTVLGSEGHSPGPARFRAFAHHAGAMIARTALSPSPRPSASPSPSVLPVAPGAGALAQTRAFPRTDDTAFRNAIADLWLAVTTGKANYALPAFFPLAAYEKLKAIPYPEPDWRYRLWEDFALDVGAAHRLVGRDARLVRVIVPAQDAAWIVPGVCANSIGYWHVPGVRVVYRAGDRERSFGIASLISWRGVWYVVHFGAVLRPSAGGVVDQPSDGPGTPGPAGGC